MPSHVVIVESPSKAKTINKYLGSDYQVLASFGHVRDLPSKDGSVEPEQGFAMHYQVEDDSKKHVSAIAQAVKKADSLILATDPDREGEAISWHVLEALKAQKALPKDVTVSRVTFHEITKKAVTEAMKRPREIDMCLVNAQQARRALDYLVGFNLSPVLWRKLPGSRSAGRVQSVALRLVCERDAEIEAFRAQEYWDVTIELTKASGESFTARLTHFNGEKLEKFSLANEKAARAVEAALQGAPFTVASLEQKQVRRNPQAPFTTSTLQQEASRKLGFSAKKTMQLAQKLYEGMEIGGETVGLITYMRTDGVTVSQEAVDATRAHIGKAYGDEFLPARPREYKVKTINSQEAHEAIRPTDIARTPEKLEAALERDMHRLYELIWKRMVASQMESAVFDQLIAELTTPVEKSQARAVGSVLKFKGFLALYREDTDDNEESTNEQDRRLPPLSEQEKLATKQVKPEQHFTEPPPRFTEASLVKKLEELGIGRPSTYASILSVLQDRGYVTLEKRRFTAATLGRLVNAFLVSFFERYVEYDFTAKLENQLDEVSEGTLDWKELLRAFWEAFIAQVNEGKAVPNPQVMETLDRVLEPYLFRGQEGGDERRKCPTCSNGRLGLKTGKFGAFLGCSNYPDCSYTRRLDLTPEPPAEGESANGEAPALVEPKLIGTDPKTGDEIHLKKGPYGWYVQRGNGEKPKRAGLPKNTPPSQITMETALRLLSLPREVGVHPESGKMILANFGRFGPYVQHDGTFTTLPKDESPLTIGINRAVILIAEAAEKRANRPPGTGRFGKRKAAKEAPVAKEKAPKKKAAAAKKKPAGDKKAPAKAKPAAKKGKGKSAAA